MLTLFPLVGCCCVQWRRTALFWASAYGHQEVVELLLGAGADIDAADKVCAHPKRNPQQHMWPWLLQVVALFKSCSAGGRGVSHAGSDLVPAFSVVLIVLATFCPVTVHFAPDRFARRALCGANCDVPW
jgi:hypothetical protein